MWRLTLILLTFCIWSADAQTKRMTTSIDTTRTKIGAQIVLKIQTTVDTLSQVAFPEGLSIGALEVVESYPVDTLREKDRFRLLKKYALTQWDSGSYKIPSLPVFINQKIHMTDSFQVYFQDVEVDTIRQPLYDVKDYFAAESKSKLWPFILGIFLILMLIGLAIWAFLKYKRKPQVEEEVFVYTSPIEKAVTQLKALEQKKESLVEHDDLKAYYSNLTDIARNYLEESVEIPALESTTAELMKALEKAMIRKKMRLSEEAIRHLEQVLRQADLVKFAKSKPIINEVIQDTQMIQEVLVTIDQAIPKVVEEDLEVNAETLVEIQKRKRTKKRVMVAIVSVFVVLNAIGFTIVSMGWEKFSDTVFGHPNKKLLEQEWVSSIYGNPPIRLESPEPLVRTEGIGFIDPAFEKVTKESQHFTYNTPTDRLFISYTSLTFKDIDDIHLSIVLESSLKQLEALGAYTVLVKEEAYNAENGIAGLKAFGSFMMPIPEKETDIKMAYRALLFKQSGGLQMLVMMHREDDTFAFQIRERLFDKAEMGQLK